MTTSDLAAVLAAIDAGDDSALPALADLLEEQGDPRAAGARRVSDRRYHCGRRPGPFVGPDGCCWHPGCDLPFSPGWLEGTERQPAGEATGEVSGPLFRRLAGGVPAKLAWAFPRGGKMSVPAVAYPTRSAAFLALAAALAAALAQD